MVKGKIMKQSRAHWGFTVWTAFLSIAFAALLFPTIVHEYGVAMSLCYTGLGVGFIWFLYFAVGRLLEWAVAEELQRRGIDPRDKNGRVEEAPKVG